GRRADREPRFAGGYAGARNVPRSRQARRSRAAHRHARPEGPPGRGPGAADFRREAVMKKLWIPAVIGLALVGALVAQARTRGGAATPAPNPVAAHSGVRAEGRIVTYPGGEVTVSAEYPGTIVALRVEEKSVVKKGDVIAEIRADDERA